MEKEATLIYGGGGETGRVRWLLGLLHEGLRLHPERTALVISSRAGMEEWGGTHTEWIQETWTPGMLSRLHLRYFADWKGIEEWAMTCTGTGEAALPQTPIGYLVVAEPASLIEHVSGEPCDHVTISKTLAALLELQGYIGTIQPDQPVLYLSGNESYGDSRDDVMAMCEVYLPQNATVPEVVETEEPDQTLSIMEEYTGIQLSSWAPHDEDGSQEGLDLI